MDQKYATNVQSRGKSNTFLNLVITTVISSHLCKISRKSFNFLRTLRNITKISSKTGQCPQQRDTCREMFLSTFKVRVIQKTSVQNFIR